MKLRVLSILLILLAYLPQGAQAQMLAMPDQKEYVDSLRQELDYGPYYGLYKDNYFIVGTDPTRRPTAINSDVKFQLSFMYRLTEATLPWNTFLFVQYTQKTFWNVFQESLPMRDNNYNPGIGLTKAFFSKDRYIGKLTLLLEHESNGRDGDASRSWNRVSLCASTVIDRNLMVHFKTWIPIIDGQNNKDILKYSGIYQGGVVYKTNNENFSFGLTWVKRKGWNFNFNTIWEASWRVSKKMNLNLYAQYYNGYGENLIDYNQFHSRLRVGIVFKPKFFSEF